jgi:antitoxin component YwqK of YwqJK toxin-antitoxin module
VVLEDRSAQLAELLARRAEQARGGVAFPDDLQREALDEETARKLFVMAKKNFDFDPFCYFRYAPNIVERIEWSEHPNGTWTRRTNSAGYREDANLPADPSRFVLVSGDSHTDGVCDNAESFPNLLEARLAKTNAPADVLNTGIVGYSFYNYLGVLEKFADRAPEAFIIAVYGGNDFIEVLRPHHYFRGSQPPPRPHGYWERIEEAKKVSTTALAQGLNQTLYFQVFPEEAEIALEGAWVTIGEMARICRERGIRFLVVYIPPAFEAGWSALDTMRAKAMESLGLDEEDLLLYRRVAEEFFAGLEDRGIESIDMEPLFEANEADCYWKRDLHINLEGHRLIADVVEEWLASPGTGPRPLRSELIADGPFERRDGGGQLRERGQYATGLREGTWEAWFAAGARESSGVWAQGLKNGPWIWWYPSRAVKKEGGYANGRKSGIWTEHHPSGEMRSTCRWEAGRPEGPWDERYPDGSSATRGPWKGGEKEGTWTHWFEGGQIQTEGEYAAGRLDGRVRKWHREGQQLFEGAYQNGLRDGAWTFWYPSGQLRRKGRYGAGAEDGRWEWYLEDGGVDPARAGVYRNGRRISP